MVSDNLEALASLPDDVADLVYLDPPFNSGRAFDAVMGSSRSTGGSQHVTEGFNDSWHWSGDVDRLQHTLAEWTGADVASIVSALTTTLRRSDLAAYLVMMAPRLSELHRVLRETGSLYLHCDPSASHYLKVILDHIFGPENFRNEIIWKRTHAHSSSRRYGPVHDTILLYSKSPKYKWNPMYSDYQDSYVEKYFTKQDGGGRYQLITCTAPGDRTGTKAHYPWRGQYPPPGRHWAWKREQMELFEAEGRLVHSVNGVPRLKRYTTDGQGVPIQDIWTDINRLDAHSEERVGYDTQKPVSLLERMIAASSDAGDTVLDPFVGSGTTLVAAERLKRQWIGIDSSLLAASIALGRVRQEAGALPVKVQGFPTTPSAAASLRRHSPEAFGVWGTSMLATVADRRTYNGTLAAGIGCIPMGRRRLQLLSWVPIAAPAVGVVPVTRQARLATLGFVLRSGRKDDFLVRWLEQRTKAHIHLLDVDDLTASESRDTGLATLVLKKAAAA